MLQRSLDTEISFLPASVMDPTVYLFPRSHGVTPHICFQSIVGVMIQACMVGIIFSKLARPKKRASTLMFSRNAVVCQRDGTNCLLFRF